MVKFMPERGVKFLYKSVKEVAKELGISTRTVYRLLESKQLQGVKAGRLWRISDEALKAYYRWHVNNKEISTNCIFDSGRTTSQDDFNPFGDTGFITNNLDANKGGCATRTQPRRLGGIRGASRVKPREVGAKATREIPRSAGKSNELTHPRFFLEYVDEEGEINTQMVPFIFEEEEDSILLHGKSAQGEPQTICIRKNNNEKLKSINLIIESDLSLTKELASHYDEHTGTFNWQEIFQHSNWTESHLAALKWMYYIDNDQLQGQSVDGAEGIIELLQQMDKHVQAACLESLKVLL